LGFFNTGIGDRVYYKGNWIVKNCRKTGICILLKPIKDLRQKIK